MWRALQKTTEQRVPFSSTFGDGPVREGPFTAVVHDTERGYDVDVCVSDSFKTAVSRHRLSLGTDQSVASFHTGARQAERAVLDEIKARTFGACTALRDMIFKYRFRHAFGRDTGTVLRVAQHGSEMRKRLAAPPTAEFVAACRDRGLFDWQARQVWAYTTLPRSVEWREIIGDGKGVRAFASVYEPAIRIGLPRSRVAGAMVNGTGFGKTVMAAMVPLLAMWDEKTIPAFDFSRCCESSFIHSFIQAGHYSSD